jgi:DNA-binding GntR family transcriptional regulator
MATGRGKAPVATKGRAEASRPTMNPVAQSSVVDRVGRELRRAVLAGRLRPGQKFSISQLSAELGVSHIPVREALRHLESQGLVQLRPGRSGVVTPINEADLHEIYLLREAIETALIGEAAPKYTDDHLATLHDHLVAMEAEVADPEGDQFWFSHHRFHWGLLEPAASAWSERLLEPLWHAAERYLRLFFVEGAQLGPSMKEHMALYEAATRRSSEALSEVLRTHLRENLETLTRSIRTLETNYLS